MTRSAGSKTNALAGSIKRLGTAIMAVLLLASVVYGQDLDKGIYSIKNTVSHDNAVGQGMARSYTEETSQLEVNDQGLYLTLGFNNTQYMGDFTIKVDGNTSSYEVVSHNTSTNIKQLKIKIPAISSKVTVGMYVVPMSTEVAYTVTLNESTLTLIKKSEPQAASPDSQSSGNVQSTAGQNASSSTPASAAPQINQQGSSTGGSISSNQNTNTSSKPSSLNNGSSSTKTETDYSQSASVSGQSAVDKGNAQVEAVQDNSSQAASNSTQDGEKQERPADGLLEEAVDLAQTVEEAAIEELTAEEAAEREDKLETDTEKAGTKESQEAEEMEAITSSTPMTKMVKEYRGALAILVVLVLMGAGIGIFYRQKKHKESEQK